ncbi:MAG TPA: DUF1801 domain-containing protein [Anaerolineales bacterium]|nr:DUF1801 domain-containing protein [Anaerolineales bacterium]
MQSDVKDVSTYTEEVPAERQDALRKLRELCQRHLTGFTEDMAYGGLTYSRNGEVEVGFASQKNFIGLYILRTDVMNAHRDQLKGKGISLGKGAIRYSKPERIDFNVVESMLRATVQSTGPVC